VADGGGTAGVSEDVAVYLAAGGRDLLAGHVHPSVRDGESISFGYADRYLAGPDAYPLDPALPLVTGALQAPAGRATFGAFADCSPDYWGRMLTWRAEQARAKAAGTDPRPIGELDVLLGVRDDLRQGALRFARGEPGPFVAAGDWGIPGRADLPALLDSADRAVRGEADGDDLRRLVPAGSSIGGWRPKVHFLDAAGRAAIAKFPKPDTDTWNVMAWEKVALDLARDAGVRVCASQLIRVGERHVLIVSRFDRHDGARTGYASARTMLQAGQSDRRSYLEIAAVIEEQSPAVTADLRELWRRIAFSVLISNIDDHLRNHGFLRQPAGWRLSPAFDINPDARPGPKHLSTAIDATSTLASVETLMSVTDHFRLDAGAALGILGEVTRAAGRWREVATSCGLQQGDLDAMEPAFEHAESERARALTSGRPAGS
jgi:serine/threonine-protein kinase HipA